MDGREPETGRKASGDSLRILAAENWELANVLTQRKDFASITVGDCTGGGTLWWQGGRCGEQEAERPVGGAGISKRSRPGLKGPLFKTEVVGLEVR